MSSSLSLVQPNSSEYVENGKNAITYFLTYDSIADYVIHDRNSAMKLVSRFMPTHHRSAIFNPTFSNFKLVSLWIV